MRHRYRTLSIHVENTQHEKGARAKGSGNAATDPAEAIRNIDVHQLNVDEVFRRYSIAPQVGLEAESVARKAKLGKNLISSPPTHYWKKIVNYVFGGFNFLMWIAFILTVVSLLPMFVSMYDLILPSFASCLISHSVATPLRYIISV